MYLCIIDKHKQQIMDYFNFDRHEKMSAEMRALILELIDAFPISHPLHNALYGLFDGYYYNDNINQLVEAKVNGIINELQYRAARYVFTEVQKWETTTELNPTPLFSKEQQRHIENPTGWTA